MKVILWTLLHMVLNCANALDCNTTTCMTKLCDLMAETAYFGITKCPLDKYCLTYPFHYFGNEYNTSRIQYFCTACPHGVNDSICNRCGDGRTYESCGSEMKCYSDSSACDGRKDCEDGTDEVGCNNLETRRRQNRLLPEKYRISKCPFDNVYHGKYYDNCTLCPHGGDEDWCTTDFCKSKVDVWDKQGFYMKCPNDPKCISVNTTWTPVTMCDGTIDCASDGYDEEHCSEMECDALGMFKCPNESRCINKRFQCDGDEHFDHWHMSESLRQEKCQYNADESELICSKFCDKKSEYACPYEIGKAKLSKLCISYNQPCNILEKVADWSNLTIGGYLWRCSTERSQWIPSDRKCNGESDCQHNEDEIESLCGDSLMFLNNILITFGLVIGIILISMLGKLVGRYIHPTSCDTCLQPHKHSMSDEEWSQTTTLLSLLFKRKGKEWIVSENIKYWNNQKKIKKAYTELHDNPKQLKSAHRYIFKRINVMFTWRNMMTLVEWRYQSIYKPLYELELKIHGENPMEAVRCLKNHLGTCKEASAILYFKNEPSYITKAAVILNMIGKTVELKKACVPIIKAFSFIFDLLKDVVLLLYMINVLTDETLTGKQNSYDYGLVAFSITAILFGQMVISVYAFQQRYAAFSICPNNTPTGPKAIFICFLVLLFPLTGLAMAVAHYFDDKKIEKAFDDVENQIDWSNRSLSKEEYENILSLSNYVERENLFGFPDTKMVESILESYWQVLIFLSICIRGSYDGVLNNSIFGILQKDGFSSEQLFFVAGSITSYFFIILGIVGFIAEKQRHSLLLKEKIWIILIYIIQSGLCLYTTLALFTLALTDSNSLIFTCYTGILIFKVIVLLTLCLFEKGSDITWSNLMVLTICNTNVPIILEEFQGQNNGSNTWNFKGFKKLLLVWFLNLAENIVRGIFFSFLASIEISTDFPLLSVNIMWIIIITAELVVISMWHIYFKYMYMWKDLITYDVARISSDENELSSLLHKTESIEDVRNRRKSLPLDGCTPHIQGNMNRIMSTSVASIHFDTAMRSKEEEIIEDSSVPTRCYFQRFYHFFHCNDVEHYCVRKCNTKPKELCLKNKQKYILRAMLLFGLVLVLVLLNSMSVTNNSKTYADCHAVMMDGNGPGLYELQFNTNITKYVYCEDGMMLIQKTNPFVGNRKYYFDRSFKEYEEGFGYSSMEYWAGLKYIWMLNQIGNNILYLHMTIQENGTDLWARFDNFSMIRYEQFSSWETSLGEINSTPENYIIHSLGNQTYSNNKIIFIRHHPGDKYRFIPACSGSSLCDGSLCDDTQCDAKTAWKKGQWPIKSQGEADKIFNRSQFIHYEFMQYQPATGFKTYDNLEAANCAVTTRSGWWFNLLVYPYSYCDRQQYCDHSIDQDTNLNGYYDENPHLNQRGIIICTKNSVDECLGQEIASGENEWGQGNCEVIPEIGHKNKNLLSIKLTKTKMYLGRQP